MTEHPIQDTPSEQRQVRDAYGIALLLVLGSVLGLIIAGSPVVSPLAALAGLLQVVALIVTLRVSGVSRKLSTTGSVLISLAFVAGVVAALGGSAGARYTLAIWVALTVATIAAIVRRLATYRHVNLQLVMGLLVVYVLLGVMFGLAYTLVESFTGAAFAQGRQGISGGIYFSFVTLSTLGYGDLSPQADVARALAVAEAIVGQLYLVSVVSLAVSRLGTRRAMDMRGHASDEGDS